MSSIESAPATIPATSARIFAAAFAPPFAGERQPLGAAALPARTGAASAITGTSPAHDTRFGSSNRTLIARRAWDSRIQRMPFCAVPMWTFASHIVPAQRGIRALRPALTSEFRRWIQAEQSWLRPIGRWTAE